MNDYAERIGDSLANGGGDAGAAAGARSIVCNLSKSNLPRALDEARRIRIPWYRVQSLAIVARAAHDDAIAEPILLECLMIAESDTQRYRTVAVMAWPVAACGARSMFHLGERLALAAWNYRDEVLPLVSRCDALALLWQASLTIRSSISDEIALGAAEAGFAAVRAGSGHQARSRIASHVLTTASVDPALAERLLRANPDAGHADRLRERLARGERYPPRQVW